MQMVPNYDVLWSSANHLKVNLTPNIHSLVSILCFKSTLRNQLWRSTYMLLLRRYELYEVNRDEHAN